MPFIENSKIYGKGIFVLVKTSNKSSIEIQDQIIIKDGTKLKLSEVVAALVNEWGNNIIGEYGYSSIGAVIGATFPKEIKEFRKIMPHTYFLIPGIGAQGGVIKDVVDAFDSNGLGTLINVSRSVIFAYKNKPTKVNREYALDSRDEVIRLNEEFRSFINQ